jgi:hypothetical protein
MGSADCDLGIYIRKDEEDEFQRPPPGFAMLIHRKKNPRPRFEAGRL